MMMNTMKNTNKNSKMNNDDEQRRTQLRSMQELCTLMMNIEEHNEGVLQALQ